MSTQFLTNLSEQEFKEFLKDALKEILSEQLGAVKQQLPDILNIKEASEFLKLKITTLYEKTSRKQIPHFKKGNKLYFYLSELQNWIKQGKVKTREEIESEAVTYTLNNHLKKAA
ncbi:MAG: helix-turn-helix domain-containing protein [Bacteroidetes bacterium]|nr:helix-turn-helix domain-containing protein [Bacteroidota bacterium]